LHEVTITYISTQSPAVDAVSLYDSTRTTLVSSMDPQIEYAIKVTVTDNNLLSDLRAVKVTLFYDADGTYNAGEVPTAGNSQTCAMLTCNVDDTPSWNEYCDPTVDGITWTIESSNCTQPDLNSITGDFWFHFKPSKIATETVNPAKWHIHAVADDGIATSTGHQDSIDINWYGEIVVNTASIDWGKIAPDADFSDLTKVTGISVTHIANGAYAKQVAASRSWTSDSDNMTLNMTGAPVANEFSLKANDSADLSSAQLVTASPNYITIGNSDTQTDEHGDTVTTNTLWLKSGSPFADEINSGTIYYRISR